MGKGKLEMGLKGLETRWILVCGQIWMTVISPMFWVFLGVPISYRSTGFLNTSCMQNVPSNVWM